MDFASIETDFEALMPTLSGLGTALETAAPALGKDLNALVTDMKAVLAALH